MWNSVGVYWLYSKDWKLSSTSGSATGPRGRCASWNSRQCRPSRALWVAMVCGETSWLRASWRKPEPATRPWKTAPSNSGRLSQ